MAVNRETQLTLKVPSDFNPNMRAELAEKVIEFIRDRSRKGLNVSGNDWPGKAGEYTEAYARRKGVSEGGPVDLSLSHDMLDGIRYFTSKSPTGAITIGYQKGTLLERQADGNIRGTYGQPEPIRGKARPFLDILRRDLQGLIDEVREDNE